MDEIKQYNVSNSLEYVQAVAGQEYINYIQTLVNDGLTPHMVGHKVHKALLDQYEWNAAPPFIRAVGDVAREMMRKEST